LTFAAIADCTARGADPAINRRIGDDTPSPDGFDQFLLADHAIAIADQECQHVEYLRLDRQKSRPTAELASVSIENKIVEGVEQDRIPSTWHARLVPTGSLMRS